MMVDDIEATEITAATTPEHEESTPKKAAVDRYGPDWVCGPAEKKSGFQFAEKVFPPHACCMAKWSALGGCNRLGTPSAKDVRGPQRSTLQSP
jgi:hypothetical protein